MVVCRVRPATVLEIRDGQGALVESDPARKDAGERVLPAAAAYLLTDILKGAVRPGLGIPAAAKSGTTTDFKDAWYVGYTSDIAVASWMGRTVMSPTPHNESMNGLWGETGPAMAWRQFIKTFYAGHKPAAWARPADVVSATLCKRHRPAGGPDSGRSRRDRPRDQERLGPGGRLRQPIIRRPAWWWPAWRHPAESHRRPCREGCPRFRRCRPCPFRVCSPRAGAGHSAMRTLTGAGKEPLLKWWFGTPPTKTPKRRSPSFRRISSSSGLLHDLKKGGYSRRAWGAFWRASWIRSIQIMQENEELRGSWIRFAVGGATAILLGAVAVFSAVHAIGVALVPHHLPPVVGVC